MMPFRTDIGRVAASLPDPLLRLDDRGVVLWRSDRFRELGEGEGPTLLGRPLRELAHPHDRALVGAALTGLDGGAATAGAHVRVRLADSTYAPADLTFLCTPASDPHERFVTVLLRTHGS